MTCSTFLHETMKAIPHVWRALPLCGTGYQDDGVDTLELRQCDGYQCRSTLARIVPRIVCRQCGMDRRVCGCGHGAQVIGKLEQREGM